MELISLFKKNKNKEDITSYIANNTNEINYKSIAKKIFEEFDEKKTIDIFEILENKFDFYKGILVLLISIKCKNNKINEILPILKSIIKYNNININDKTTHDENIFVILTSNFTKFQNSLTFENIITEFISLGGDINSSDGIYNLIFEVVKIIINSDMGLYFKMGQDIISFLIEKGANINSLIRDKKGIISMSETDIFLDIYTDHNVILLIFLIENGYQVNKRDIYFLLHKKRFDLLKKILNNRTDISFNLDEIDIYFRDIDIDPKLLIEFKKFLSKRNEGKTFQSIKSKISMTTKNDTPVDLTYIKNSENKKKEIKRILKPSIKVLEKLDKKLINPLILYSKTTEYCIAINSLTPFNYKDIKKIDMTRLQKDRRNLDKVFLMMPAIEEEIIVYRGIKNMEALKTSLGLYDNSYCGSGYISTSYDISTALRFAGVDCCLLSITIPAGSKIVPLFAISENPEAEVLLPINSEFVQSNEYYYNDMKIYDLTYKVPSSEILTLLSDSPLSRESSYSRNSNSLSHTSPYISPSHTPTHQFNLPLHVNIPINSQLTSSIPSPIPIHNRLRSNSSLIYPSFPTQRLPSHLPSPIDRSQSNSPFMQFPQSSFLDTRRLSPSFMSSIPSQMLTPRMSPIPTSHTPPIQNRNNNQSVSNLPTSMKKFFDQNNFPH